MGRMVAYGVAYALAIVVGRLIVLPETNLALFWPAAGVGALWALVTPSRRQLAVVAAAIWVLSTAGLTLTGIPADAAVVLGLANVANSVGTAVGYTWLTAQSTAEPVEWHGGGAAPLRRLSDVGRFSPGRHGGDPGQRRHRDGRARRGRHRRDGPDRRGLGAAQRCRHRDHRRHGSGHARAGRDRQPPAPGRGRARAPRLPRRALAGVRAGPHDLAVVPPARGPRLGRAAAAGPARRAPGGHDGRRHPLPRGDHLGEPVRRRRRHRRSGADPPGVHDARHPAQPRAVDGAVGARPRWSARRPRWG